MRILLIIILIFPCIIFAQESIEIKHLSNAINSVGAELNFFQDEKNHAFLRLFGRIMTTIFLLFILAIFN